MAAKMYIKHRVCLLTLCFALMAGTSLGQYTTDLVVPNSIPCYCQETGISCGAATAQMILEGYPGGVNHVYTQTHIWNTIQTYLDDPGVNWATDPDGLAYTLMDLGPGANVHWVVFHKPDRNELLFSVAYWMAQREYPVATLVYGFQHWVAVTGITTDVSPLTNTTVNLQWIRIFNPASSPCPTASSGGVDSTMNSAKWFTNYWYAPGNIPASKWDGNYIAVIEPPIPSGRVEGEPNKVSTGEVISPAAAIDYAYQWLDMYNLTETYRAFAHITALEPLLVNSEQDGYYAVPFGYKEGDFSLGAILVNAYTGEFQEIGTFSQPRRLLQMDDAVRLALNYLRCDCEAEVVDARLRFQPSMQTNTPFLPVWEVFIYHPELEARSLLVSMDGMVADRFILLPLGD